MEIFLKIAKNSISLLIKLPLTQPNTGTSATDMKRIPRQNHITIKLVWRMLKNDHGHCTWHNWFHLFVLNKICKNNNIHLQVKKNPLEEKNTWSTYENWHYIRFEAFLLIMCSDDISQVITIASFFEVIFKH